MTAKTATATGEQQMTTATEVRTREAEYEAFVQMRQQRDDLRAALKLALDIIENDDGMGHGLDSIRAALKASS